jgi:hypothetical protein
MASANSGDQPSITKGNLLQAANAYGNIAKLFKIVFGHLSDGVTFSYDNSKKKLGELEDPFFIIKPEEGTYNLDNIAEWYESKNPEYKPVNKVAFNVPEFNFILAVMLKDLVLLSTIKKYPLRDSKNTVEPRISEEPYEQVTYNLPTTATTASSINFDELFRKINSEVNMESGILYIKFLDILSDYITIFSLGILYSQLDSTFPKDAKDAKGDNKWSELHKDIAILETIKKIPYIIYPSLIQISYDKVLYTIQAPVINFRLNNKRRFIHNRFYNSIFEISHDISMHATLTHMYQLNISGDKLKKFFTNRKTVLDMLKEHISFSLYKKTDNINYYDRKMVAYIIFYMVHETISGTSSILFELNTVIHMFNDIGINFSDNDILDLIFNIYKNIKSLDSATKDSLKIPELGEFETAEALRNEIDMAYKSYKNRQDTTIKCENFIKVVVKYMMYRYEKVLKDISIRVEREKREELEMLDKPLINGGKRNRTIKKTIRMKKNKKNKKTKKTIRKH